MWWRIPNKKDIEELNIFKCKTLIYRVRFKNMFSRKTVLREQGWKSKDSENKTSVLDYKICLRPV